MIPIGATVESRPHPRALRSGAIFFVLLYLLAAVRGLVPGLCLNLRAAEFYTGETCIESAPSACCSALSEEEGGPGSAPAAPERCPFCRLALGLTESPQFVHFDPLPAPRHNVAFPPAADAAPRDAGHACSGRAPPVPLTA